MGGDCPPDHRGLFHNAAGLRDTEVLDSRHCSERYDVDGAAVRREGPDSKSQ